MKFKGLYLTEEGEPKFNQPVPLVMVPLIADWECDLLLDLLGNGVFIGPQVVYPLDAHAYDGTENPKSNHRSFYKKLRRELEACASEYERLQQLPPHHFVWSSDLANGFSDFIDLTLSRGDAHQCGLHLMWGVDTAPIQEALEKCPDFHNLLDPTAIRRGKSLERYEDICRRRQELIDSGLPAYTKGQGPSKTPNELAIARKIAKDYNLSVDHIRKLMRSCS